MTFMDSLPASRRQADRFGHVSPDSFAPAVMPAGPFPVVATVKKALVGAFFVALPILAGCDRHVVVRGQVIAATGLPATAARVTLTRATDSSISTETDALGCFSLEYADGGWDPRDRPVTITAWHRGLGTSTITTTRSTINATPLRITLGQDRLTTAPAGACATTLDTAATEETPP